MSSPSRRQGGQTESGRWTVNGAVNRLGVVGAGTMGAQIAALAASSGLPVVLLDVAGDGRDRNAVARAGIERAIKARPAAFMDSARVSLIQIGNIEDDLPRLAECDWVIEAIIEQIAPKRALFEQLDDLLDERIIVTTNTSAIPIHELAAGRSDGFRSRFFGTHFFNPPRYLHLLELIPTTETGPAVMQKISGFAERILGKGTVLARDVPGFIGNRIGIYGLIQAIRLMEECDLTIDEVDALTGELIGHPRSAIFRTADLTGLDVLLHVADGLSAATGDDFGLPGWVRDLVEQGRLGEKTGVGFYRRESRDILTLDYPSGEYRPRASLRLPELGPIGKLPLNERLAATWSLPGKYGEFSRRLFLMSSEYTLNRAPEIAYDLVAIDRAMRWGFGWELGPFQQIDAVGPQRVRQELAADGLDEPELLRRAEPEGFYRSSPNGDEEHLAFDGDWTPLPATPGVIELSRVRSAGSVVHERGEASLLDLGGGVMLVEFHSKLNAIGEGILRSLAQAIETVERQGYLGLVIGNEDARAFSAGANLAWILSTAQEGDWNELARACRMFQRASMSIRQASFPIVVAPAGLTLGGGCEFMLHADQVQAHAELYAGLVEFGVGIIPAGGGTKELLFRFTKDLEPYPEADPFAAVQRAFTLIGLARTSTSALEARSLGLLRPQDRITMNRDRLLADARSAVLELAPNYVPPIPATITALGREALGNLRYAVWSLHEAGQASEHDVVVGEALAYVLAGGDGPPRPVTEQDILDLEREAFLKLAGTRKTQERMAYMLKTGKPLRN